MLAAVSPPQATGDEEIGRRVRERRDELNMSQAGLAKRAGKSQSWISALERGSTSTDIDGLRALARALDVTVAWLLGEPPLPGYSDEWALLSPTSRERFNRALGYLLETFGQPEEQEEPPA